MKPLGEINVIPFIDIMLVLLAVVLTTATFVAQGQIPVRLAEARSTAPVEDTPPLALAIAPDGALFVGDAPSSLAALATQLAELPRTTPVLLRVDEQAAFRHFVAVIDLLKARNMENLSIAARPAS
jgi:biopolymer transport protein ExbD